MWMVDPELLCRNHLLGEHLELHMLAGCLDAGMKITGYIAHGLVDPGMVAERHAQLVTEMRSRGYKHASPMPSLPEKREKGHISPDANLRVLAGRCEECRKRIQQKSKPAK
jgi:hypothetical protein